MSITKIAIAAALVAVAGLAGAATFKAYDVTPLTAQQRIDQAFSVFVKSDKAQDRFMSGPQDEPVPQVRLTPEQQAIVDAAPPFGVGATCVPYTAPSYDACKPTIPLLAEGK
jgi:hypothetical protein